MPSYIKASLERSYAESFLAELERNENQYFFFIAKGTTWANENSPDAYTDTVAAEYSVMNNVIAYKKLSAQNLLFALPRYEWESGTVYDQYDDTVNLFDVNNPKIFYVASTDGALTHIYKCLFNGNGVVSTQQPTGTSFTPFTLSDGYTWKYLGTVRESDLPYELTDYIPIDYAVSAVDTETTNQYSTQLQAINGEITRFVISSYPGTIGVYPNTINTGSTYVLNVTSIETVSPGVKRVKITDSTSRAKISGTLNDFIGYAMRVDQLHATNVAERGNYGIIIGVSSTSNEVVFTVRSDVNEFNLTAQPTSGSAKSSVEIIPFIKIVGDGSGAFAYPVMNSSKQISRILVGNGGRGYSQARIEIISPRQSGTTHPVVRAVIAPKGGHGSNILKELNVKDVLVVCEILDSDSAKVVGGGSYRQFGIIKNPVLNDGSGQVAGKTDLYFRDISLVANDGILDINNFDLSASNLVLGQETYSSSRIVAVRSQFSSGINGTNTDTVVIKTVPSNGKYITRQDRPDDVVLTLPQALSPTQNFVVGEGVVQVIPEGTVITPLVGNPYTYTYSTTVTGTVVGVEGNLIAVRITSGGNFVADTSINVSGLKSGAVSSVSKIVPRYGELVWITKRGTDGNPTFTFSGSTPKLYRVVETGLAYFEQNLAPAYSGLHTLSIGTSINSVVGVNDVSYAPLTPNSFSNGEVVHQGVTGNFGHYANGVVYNWDFVNSSKGTLYLTDVYGSFRSVATHGLSGSTLSAYVVTDLKVPDIDPGSGEVLYINNVRPVQRVTGQEEEFRIRLGF